MHTLMMPDDCIHFLYTLKKELRAVYSVKATSQETLNSGAAVWVKHHNLKEDLQSNINNSNFIYIASLKTEFTNALSVKKILVS